MAQYPYLDVTVMPDIRDHVVSPRAAVLFAPDLKAVLWANGEGALLIGASTIREALEGTHKPDPVMMRQIAVAAQKLDTTSEARANIRLKSGFKTRLLGFRISNFTLPGGADAVLLISDSLHGRSHSRGAMAQMAVDGLDGYSHASAVLDEDGVVVAASEYFGALELDDEKLHALVREVENESDRLIKRPIKTGTGNRPAGIARLTDGPRLHLLVIANAEAEVVAPIEEKAPADPPPEPSSVAADSAEEATSPAPFSGRFSNRRERPSSKRLNRWYYKTEEPEPEPVEFLSYDDELPLPKTETESETEPAYEAEVPSESAVEAGEDQGLKAALSKMPITGDVDQSEPEHSEPTEDGANTDFRFRAGAKPVRFVWEMDGGNAFLSISDELAAAVGPKSAAVTGLAWEEVGQARGLANTAEISALLEKGDTWSGKTVLWPVQGTDLRVPIDLAGLPSFDRTRSFSGFTGFGIIRTADAMIDPDGGGLDLVGTSEETPQEPDDDFGREAGPTSSVRAAGIEDTKIVDIETRRSVRADRELSSVEQTAFDEIAQRLAKAKIERPAATETKPKPSRSRAPEPFTPSAFAKRIIDEHDESLATEPASRSNEVDTSILAKLPIPVLVYRGNDMLFGNDEFFDLTGYADLSDLATRGGVNALFGLSNQDGDEDEAVIYHRDGHQLDVRAHLQRVPWDEQRAMLLTLRRNGGGPGERKPEPLAGESETRTVPSAPEADAPGDNQDLRPSIRDAAPISLGVEGEQPASPLLDEVDQAGSDSETEKTLPPTVDEPISVDPPEEPLVSEPPVAEVWIDQPERTKSKAFGGLTGDDMRGIVDVATDGIIILSLEGTVRALNRSAEALFDVSPEKIEGQSITKLLAPESHRIALDYLSGMSGTGVASLLNDGREIIGQTRNGGLIPLFMTVGKLENSDACCAVMRDITHFKKAEEDLVKSRAQAESANALKSDFLAKISHEVRTPLNAIIGFSDLMIEERFGRIDNDRYRGYLRDIRRSGNHVLELINDLLDISKIEAGKVDLDFDACDLNNIVSEAVAMTQPAANIERVIIRTSLSAVVPKVVADPRSIRQIVLNIVSNAIKYTKQGGQVIVSTVYDENGEVVLRIRDTGVGMSELDLARAMKPFQQVGNVREAHTRGTGLGLPLTKALVEANRARFLIESTPDEGTMVEIHFPIQRVLADR